MAKVILVDNLGRDSVADKLLKDEISEKEAQALAIGYNNAHGENYPYYARVVADDHKLWRGMAELV